MCGLVSIIARKAGGFYSRELDLFEQMLMIDSLRGKDSTGVMTTLKNGDVQVVKTATQPFLLFETKQWMDWRSKVIQTGRYVAGHNRAATRGNVVNDNAHPFVEKHIILMHNGTISNQEQLAKEKVEVDSHAICHAMANGTPEEVIPKIWGAFALIWYNTETETLHAVRNDERPLSLITTDDYYFLASEPWMVANPAARQGRKIEGVDQLEPHKMLTFSMDGKMEVTQLPKRQWSNTTNPPTTGTTRDYQAWLRARAANGMSDDWGDDDDTLSDMTGNSIRSSQSPAHDRSSSEAKNGDGSNASANDGNKDKVNFPQGTDVTPTESSKSDPVEIVNLRKALTAGAKKREEEHSNGSSGALLNGKGSTSPNKDSPSTNTTTSASSVKLVEPVLSINAELERLESAQRMISTQLKDFPAASPVMIKIWSVDKMPNGRCKWTGKIMSPDKEMVDCQGFLPDGVMPHEWHLWIETICTGFVAWCTRSSGGPTVWVRDANRSLYCDIHGNDIPTGWWRHAVDHCKCSKCDRSVEDWERNWTHVRFKSQLQRGYTQPYNKLTVTCADCLELLLPNGELHDNFVKKYTLARNAVFGARKRHADHIRSLDAKASAKEANADCAVALPDRESVGKEPVGKNGSVIVVPGPETLH